MANTLIIAEWNANGLSNHIQEITIFLKINKIDVLLIAESHSTEASNIKIPHYNIYYTNHPDGTAHAGTAIIIRSALKHYPLQHFKTNKIQSTIIKVEALLWPLTIAAIYSPPRHTITYEEYQEYFLQLGSHFIVVGDWNAKNTAWGSRLITPKGRTLLKVIEQNNFSFLSTGYPTYWPSDLNKIPDLLDFAVTKGISDIHSTIESNLDLNSDHSPIIVTLSTDIIWKKPPPRLCSKKTDWTHFSRYINDNITLNIRLKEKEDIEKSVQYLTTLIQNASWQSTPEAQGVIQENRNIPLHIRELVIDRRRARKRWQATRNPIDKNYLNRLTHNLRAAIQEAKNESFEYYITNLSIDDNTLWKATKKFKRPILSIPPLRQNNGRWARSNSEKANRFAEHLASVFSTPEIQDEHQNEVETFLDAPCQLSLPTRAIAPAEVKKEIDQINPHKAPGYDLITGEILKRLPKKAIVLLTTIYNCILRQGYYPILWKYAQICMIPKPGKPPTNVGSYRPISLLPIMSKILERLILNRIEETTNFDDLIPKHQFGFRHRHSTTQQCHRIVNKIRDSLEKKEMCTSTFLDIKQAFDKVWHKGLLYKLKEKLPSQLYSVLKSYLCDRKFQVKYEDNLSEYHTIEAGVPQGSVLGPLLYLIYTADVPTREDTLMATFADDTAILAADSNPTRASEKIQSHLNEIQTWLKKWRISVNTDKSCQVTFTTRRTECPQLTLNDAHIPIKDKVKYLGLHLDKKLTWKEHIRAKRQQLDLKIRNMSWLINRKSKLSLKNKLSIYKCILRPIWTYGIELWGCSKPSNTKILQTFQSKTLRMITTAPWYVSNRTIHNDLNVPFIDEVISTYSNKYKKRSTNHNNPLINELFNPPLENRRLKRKWPEDLSR